MGKVQRKKELSQLERQRKREEKRKRKKDGTYSAQFGLNSPSHILLTTSSTFIKLKLLTSPSSAFVLGLTHPISSAPPSSPPAPGASIGKS